MLVSILVRLRVVAAVLRAAITPLIPSRPPPSRTGLCSGAQFEIRFCRTVLSLPTASTTRRLLSSSLDGFVVSGQSRRVNGGGEVEVFEGFGCRRICQLPDCLFDVSTLFGRIPQSVVEDNEVVLLDRVAAFDQSVGL